MVFMVAIAVIFAIDTFGELSWCVECVPQTNSTNYVYNLSKAESDQVIISELCYAGVSVSECDLLYGGSIYGEAIK